METQKTQKKHALIREAVTRGKLLTIDDIAHYAGCSRNMVYRYFKECAKNGIYYDYMTGDGRTFSTRHEEPKSEEGKPKRGVCFSDLAVGSTVGVRGCFGLWEVFKIDARLDVIGLTNSAGEVTNVSLSHIEPVVATDDNITIAYGTDNYRKICDDYNLEYIHELNAFVHVTRNAKE